MKIEIELTPAQIRCFMNFHRLAPYDRALFKSAHEVLDLLGNTFSAAVNGTTFTPVTAEEIRTLSSGRTKLLWQIHDEELLPGGYPAPNFSANHKVRFSSAQDPRKTGSPSFWNWVAQQNQS
jgi:hypothetical protein